MSKSRLEQAVIEKLRMILSGVIVLENKRPDWLISSQGERLELDFYIPELDLAIEVQGQQHYIFVPHFHLDQNGFSDQLRRDREKRHICERKGIILLEIDSDIQLDDLAIKVIDMVPQVETNKEFVGRMKEYNKTHPERIGSMKKVNWRHGKLIKAIHYPFYRHKLLNLAKTIRTLNGRITAIHKELSFQMEKTLVDKKMKRLFNLERSRDEHILCLKKFVRNWSKEIKLAFVIHRCE